MSGVSDAKLRVYELLKKARAAKKPENKELFGDE